METDRVHTELRCAVNSSESHFSKPWMGGLGPSFSLYVWSKRPPRSPVREIWCLCQAWRALPTQNTPHVIIHKSNNSGCSRSRSTAGDIRVTQHRSVIRKKHSQNCDGWVRTKPLLSRYITLYPNAWSSTACKQLRTRTPGMLRGDWSESSMPP